MEKEMPLYDGNKEYVKQNENENTTDVYCKRFLDNDKKAISVKVSKFDNRADFLKFFVEGIPYVIQKLNLMEKNILLFAMAELNYGNTFVLSSEFRKDLENILKIGQAAISKNLKSLVRKGVFIHLNAEKMTESEKRFFNMTDYTKKKYLVNPNIVGKGSFKDLLGVKRIIRQEYNFTNFEGKETIEEDYAYIGLREILENKDKYEVRNVNVSHNETGGKDIEVTLQEKECNDDNNIVDIGEVDDIKRIEEKKEPLLAKIKTAEEMKNYIKSLIEKRQLEQKEKEREEIIKNKELEDAVRDAANIIQDELIKNGKLDEYYELSDSLRELNKEFWK